MDELGLKGCLGCQTNFHQAWFAHLVAMWSIIAPMITDAEASAAVQRNATELQGLKHAANNGCPTRGCTRRAPCGISDEFVASRFGARA